MKDDSVEILFKSFLQETLVIISGMGKDVKKIMDEAIIKLARQS